MPGLPGSNPIIMLPIPEAACLKPPPTITERYDRMAKKRRQPGYKKTWLKKWCPIFIMMAPGLIYLLINNYLPMLGLFIAFKRINFKIGLWNSPWCGFDNFKFLFQNSDAWIITRNTLFYNILFIAINIVLGILFAIFLSDLKSKKAKKLYQSAILLPNLMSIVIISYIVYALLDPDKGMMNNTILPLLNIKNISWYTEPKYWPFILTIVNTWKSIGYGCLVYLAGITAIDPSYYEAAILDGATKRQQIWYITLPCLKTSVISLALLNIGRIFYSDFGLFYQVPLHSGPLFEVTNTIDTYVYRSLLTLGNVGMASAAGFYQSIVGFVFILICNLIVRRLDRESALF